MQVQAVSAREFRRVPWKNGKGMTTEICSDAAERSGVWSWRVSAADVPVRAPFSYFPGVDRHMLCIAGALRLHESATEHTVPCDGCALQFTGEAEMTGEPLAPGTRDLNLMVNRALWRGRLERLHTGAVCEETNAARIVIYCAWGDARIAVSCGTHAGAGTREHSVAAGDALKVARVEQTLNVRLTVLSGSAAVACVAPIS